MKSFLSSFSLAICITLFSHFSFGQQNNCQEALPDYLFQHKKNFVQVQSTQKYKLEAALKISESNCLSTAQIKSIVLLFIEDSEKLVFAKSAYNFTVDKQNFYEIYDTFAAFSSAIRLYDFVKSRELSTPIDTNPINTPINTPPDTYFSDFVSSEELQELKKFMKSESVDSWRNEKVTKILKKYPPSFSVSQIKELMDLYNMDSEKLAFLKIMYQYVLPNDKRRYYTLGESFSYHYKKDLLDYIDK